MQHTVTQYTITLS